MIKLTLLINIILVLNSTLHYIGFAAKGRCKLYFNGCCPSTQWDSEREICVDCQSGYYWINCSRPCYYPYYGSKCGQTCSCEEENCDHMSGCKSAPSSVKNAHLLTTSFGISGISSSPKGLSSMLKLILLINIILILNSTLPYIGFAAKGRCKLYFNGCCPNTQWNAESDMCVDCQSGYHWINCSRPCQYPYYGSKCGQNCSCEEENCNHMDGCKNEIKTSTMPSVTSEVSKTTTVDKIVTDVVSCKTRSVSTISKNVATNPLYKPLLIVSIIVGVLIVAYLSVVAVEKYCI